MPFYNDISITALTFRFQVYIFPPKSTFIVELSSLLLHNAINILLT